MIKIDPKYKEALIAISSVKQYPDFVNFLKIQRNNCMVREFKFTSPDPSVVFGEKRYYQGQVELINTLIKTIDELRKKED